MVITLRDYWSGRSQITYDRLITNDGDSNLDYSSGLWTAGSTGVYQVSWSVQMSVNKYETNRIYLMRWPCRLQQMNFVCIILEMEIECLRVIIIPTPTPLEAQAPTQTN